MIHTKSANHPAPAKFEGRALTAAPYGGRRRDPNPALQLALIGLFLVLTLGLIRYAVWRHAPAKDRASGLLRHTRQGLMVVGVPCGQDKRLP